MHWLDEGWSGYEGCDIRCTPRSSYPIDCKVIGVGVILLITWEFVLLLLLVSTLSESRDRWEKSIAPYSTKALGLFMLIFGITVWLGYCSCFSGEGELSLRLHFIVLMEDTFVSEGNTSTLKICGETLYSFEIVPGLMGECTKVLGWWRRVAGILGGGDGLVVRIAVEENEGRGGVSQDIKVARLVVSCICAFVTDMKTWEEVGIVKGNLVKWFLAGH